MKGMIAIARREILSFFVSPVAYMVLTGFMLLGAYFFFWYLSEFNLLLLRSQQMPYMQQQTLGLNQIIEAYYRTLLLVLVFLVPLLTMRLLAEEKRRGTFELLITSPVSVGSIVLGKFFGVAVTIFLMLLLAALFPGLLTLYADPEILPMLVGFLGTLLCALAFAAISMAVSSFTENQMIGGVASLVVLLLFYVISAPAESIGGVFGSLLKFLSPMDQSEDFLKGVITTRGLIYYISLISVGVFVSLRSVEMHRYR